MNEDYEKAKDFLAQKALENHKQLEQNAKKGDKMS